MIVPLFGLIVLVAVGLLALAVAVPLALTVSYVAAATVLAERTEGRRLAQLAVFLVAWLVAMVVAVVLIFTGMTGNAGSGVEVWGINLFEPIVYGVGLGASVLVVVVGELVLAKD